MYHIKEDKRAKNSAALIGRAVLDLLEQKKFDRITITDIQRTSFVGRATFYRLFDSTADVLLYLCDQTMDGVLARHRELAGKDPREICTFFIQAWIEREALLQAIVDSGHFDLLYRSFQSHAEETARYFFPGVSISPAQADYAVSVLSTAMAGAFSAWLRHGRRESAEEVFELMQEAVAVFYRMTHQE